jgi:CxxC-x17-CxxC domain-containing protein
MFGVNLEFTKRKLQNVSALFSRSTCKRFPPCLRRPARRTSSLADESACPPQGFWRRGFAQAGLRFSQPTYPLLGRFFATLRLLFPFQSVAANEGSRMQRRRHGRIRGSRSHRPNRPKFYKTVCSSCGKEVILQVPPLEGKKLMCLECFKK